MKCLSVQQPWSWAIIAGLKRLENRTWPTNYRGPILIHAGRSRVYLGDTTPEHWHEREGLPGLPDFDRLAFGAIVGVVDLVDCVPLARVAGRPFAEGPWCWVVEKPRAFAKPVPYRGKLGLFEVPHADVREALAEAARAAFAGQPLPTEQRIQL